MQTRLGFIQGLMMAMVLGLANPLFCSAQSNTPAGLQWIGVNDERLEWLNVADWETKGDGLQPVRVAKAWRDQWPKRTASRAQSAAGVAAVLKPLFGSLPGSP